MKTMRNSIHNLTSTALMAAMICIAGPIVIPVGMVPVSFVNMAIYLAIILLDKKKATISILIYLLLGFVGIPVFAGFTAGVGKLFGPTGGYLLGYPLVGWIAGMILEKGKEAGKKTHDITRHAEKATKAERYNKEEKQEEILKKSRKNIIKIRQVAALATGTGFLYLTGTLWLMCQSRLNFVTAFSTGVLPFVFLDIIKIVMAILLGNSVKQRISLQR